MSAPDRPAATNRNSAPPADVGLPWPAWLRAVVSAGVVWHLVAVMVAPLSTPPRFEGRDSVIGTTLKETYGPYVTALYLNHAYKFFAPNPGDSHLLRYDLYFADGTKQVNRDEQLLPDRLHHWPRLLYHRHFMLSEFVNDFAPPWVWQREVIPTPGVAQLGPLANADSPVAARPVPVAPIGESLPPVENAGPPHVRTYIEGIAAALAKRHNAERVDIYYRKHLLPSIDDFHGVGNRLDSPQSYRERMIYRYTAESRS